MLQEDNEKVFKEHIPTLKRQGCWEIVMEAGGHFLTRFDMFRPVFILHFQAKLVLAAARIISVVITRYPQHLIFA